MERIAFITGQTVIYWSSIVTALAALTAVFLFLALYLHKSGNWTGAMLLVPLAALLGIVLARLLHWYAYPSEYEGIVNALTDYSGGGFVLTGVFAGCVLEALRLHHSHRIEDLPQVLDCMAVAGCGGIAVGRLASFFNAADRGALLSGPTPLPVGSSCVNAVTGQTEYHFATFFFQSVGALCLLIGLLCWYLPKKRGGRKNGDAALLFTLFYCAMQAVLDSTRYDSVYLRSNGFVSLVQILSVIGLVAVAAVFSVRLIQARGFKLWYAALWLAQLGLLGAAGYMEYYVQRHGDEAVFAYSMMCSALMVYLCVTYAQRVLSLPEEVSVK